MKLNTFLKLVDVVHKSRIKILAGKSHDYAKETDALQNFKRVHQICKLWRVNPERSPADAAHFLIILKLDRWHNLREKHVEPKNESLLDTIGDLHNYTDLAYACDAEDENERAS